MPGHRLGPGLRADRKTATEIVAGRTRAPAKETLAAQGAGAAPAAGGRGLLGPPDLRGQGAGSGAARAGSWEADADLMEAMGLPAEGGAAVAGGGARSGPPGRRTAAGEATAATEAAAPGDWQTPCDDEALVCREPPAEGASPDERAVVGGSEGMWRQVIGERSSAVGKLARVSAPRGVRLRARPDLAGAELCILPFDELVTVERRTAHGWCWVVAAGSAGFCEEHFLAADPPEPSAHLHRVQPGETLGEIAARAYGANLGAGHDARLYVQALVEANRARRGVYVGAVELSLSDTAARAEDEERTLEIYRGARVRSGHAIWLPSETFIEALRASGAITSGSTEFSKAWRGAKAVAGEVVDGVRYGAAFTVGLLEGAWRGLAELFGGAVDMLQAVAEVLHQLVLRNLGAIRKMLTDWAGKLSQAWAQRSKLADEFMRKWEAEDAWTRGNFQGEVLGWVMMTALLVLATAGAAGLAATAQVSGRWASVNGPQDP